jgi:hypothetical protein
VENNFSCEAGKSLVMAKKVKSPLGAYFGLIGKASALDGYCDIRRIYNTILFTLSIAILKFSVYNGN